MRFSKIKKFLAALTASCVIFSSYSVFAANSLLKSIPDADLGYTAIGSFTGDENTLNGGWFYPTPYADSVQIGDCIFMTRGSHFRTDNNANVAQNGDGYVRVINISNGSSYNLEESTITADIPEGEGINKGYRLGGNISAPSKNLCYYIPSKLLYDKDNERLYVGYVGVLHNQAGVINGAEGGLRIYDVSNPSSPADITGTVEMSTMSDINEKYTVDYEGYIPLQFHTVRSNGDIKGEPSAVFDMVLDGETNILYCASQWGIIALDVSAPSHMRSLLYWMGAFHATMAADKTNAGTDVSADAPLAMQLDKENAKLYLATKYTLLSYDISHMSAEIGTGSKREEYFPCRWGRLCGDNTAAESVSTRFGVGAAKGALSIKGNTVKLYVPPFNFYSAEFEENEDGNHLDLTVTNTRNNSTNKYSYSMPESQYKSAAGVPRFDNGSFYDRGRFEYFYVVNKVGDIVYALSGSRNYMFIFDMSGSDPEIIDVIYVWGIYNNKITDDLIGYYNSVDASSVPTSMTICSSGDAYIFVEKIGMLKYNLKKGVISSVRFEDESGNTLESLPVSGDITVRAKVINLMPDQCEITAGAASYTSKTGGVQMYDNFGISSFAVSGGEIKIEKFTLPQPEDISRVGAFVVTDWNDFKLNCCNSIEK